MKKQNWTAASPKRPEFRSRQAGFTLIELIAALGTLAIVYQFLPAVQKVREAANRQAAEVELRTLGAKIMAGKTLPTDIDQIKSGLDSRNGFRLSAVEMSAQRLRIVSEPIAGVTGSQTGFLEVTAGPAGLSSRVNFAPTPGSDEGRKKMLSGVSAAVAQQFGRLAGWALQDFHFRLQDFHRLMSGAKSETDSSLRQQQVFQTVRGVDGRLSFASLDNWARTDSSPFRPLYEAMWKDVASALQLGAQGEDVKSLPGLSSLPAVQHSDRLLNFAVVTDLTSQFIPDGGLRSRLLNFANTAAAAEKAGDMYARKAALDSYTGELLDAKARSFQTGGLSAISSAPFHRADALNAIAEAMK